MWPSIAQSLRSTIKKGHGIPSRLCYIQRRGCLTGTVQTLNERSKASCMVYCAVSVSGPNGWDNMINWKGKGREKIKTRKWSEGNVGNEESEKRKGRERKGGRMGKEGKKEGRKGLWPNRGHIQAVAWNNWGKLSASACLSADIPNQNPTVHTLRLLSLHRDWLISQCNMEQRTSEQESRRENEVEEEVTKDKTSKENNETRGSKKTGKK